MSPPVLHCGAVLAKRTIRLSDESKGGWERLKETSGANVTAIIEALGRLLARDEIELPPEVIDLAREIQAERDSRS